MANLKKLSVLSRRLTMLGAQYNQRRIKQLLGSQFAGNLTHSAINIGDRRRDIRIGREMAIGVAAAFRIERLLRNAQRLEVRAK